MTRFSPNNLGCIRQDINKALEEVAKKHGVNFTDIGNISYGAKHFKTSFEMFISDETVLTIDTPNMDLIGKKFKEGHRIFTVLIHKGNDEFIIMTKRGTKYSIKKSSLIAMQSI
jgi:hypothetical protein